MPSASQKAAMGLRPNRRNLAVWSSSVPPAGTSGGARRPGRARPTRIRRIRWWLRVGTLLTVLGILRLVRTARICWEPLSLVVGVVLATVGFVLPSIAGVFLFGVLVLIVTLVKGISAQQRRRDPAR